jgi:hypothetical protein
LIDRGHRRLSLEGGGLSVCVGRRLIPTSLAYSGQSATRARVNCERQAAQADILIRIVWQEDRGFRLPEIRNRAIRARSFRARSYCIILNGDCIENSDLLIRLLRAGIRRKDGNFATGVLHLWHPENDRSLLADNQRRLDAVAAADRVRSIVGPSALVDDADQPGVGLDRAARGGQ